MSSTYRIPRFFQIVIEPIYISALNDLHPLSIQLFYATPYRSSIAVIVDIIKALAPMAEIAGYYKEVGGVLHIFGK